MTSEECFREATRLKAEGRIDEAVERLREGCAIPPGERRTYRPEEFLRLPMYLQAAGRVEEAWEEFGRILSDRPYADVHPSVVPMLDSIVYDKMRLFLQRAGRDDMAVAYGVAKELAWAKGTKMQIADETADARRRLAEARGLYTKEEYAEMRKHAFDLAKYLRERLVGFRGFLFTEVGSLLDKAGRRECRKAVCELVAPMAADPETFDPDAVIMGICGILGVQ